MAVIRACGSCLFWKSLAGMGKCVCPSSVSFCDALSGDMDSCEEWQEEEDRDYWDFDVRAGELRAITPPKQQAQEDKERGDDRG